MPLRPIDAIFVHPKERFYVIYQNGELHKLARMKLDKASWDHRKPYKDNVSNIFLAKNQSIEDDKLNKILTTHTLPHTLHGRSLTFFKDWWRMNGYRWSKESQEVATSNTAAQNLSVESEEAPALLGEDEGILLEEDNLVSNNNFTSITKDSNSTKSIKTAAHDKESQDTMKTDADIANNQADITQKISASTVEKRRKSILNETSSQNNNVVKQSKSEPSSDDIFDSLLDEFVR